MNFIWIVVKRNFFRQGKTHMLRLGIALSCGLYLELDKYLDFPCFVLKGFATRINLMKKSHKRYVVLQTFDAVRQFLIALHLFAVVPHFLKLVDDGFHEVCLDEQGQIVQFGIIKPGFGLVSFKDCPVMY